MRVPNAQGQKRQTIATAETPLSQQAVQFVAWIKFLTHRFPPAHPNWQVFCPVNDLIRPETQAKPAIWHQEYLPIWDARKASWEISVTGLLQPDTSSSS
jgi:hypothetical protein